MGLYDFFFPIQEGEVVDAEAKGLWLPGKVTHVVRQEGRETLYSVDYDEYQEEDGLVGARIRRRTAFNRVMSALLAYTIGFPPGTRVVADRFGRGAWQTGVINKVLRNGLYDVEYDEGQLEENVAPARIRIAPGGLDLFASLSHLLVATFTARGRLRAMGIEYDEVGENHTVPTRYSVGDKVVLFGRNGVFTVTGFAGSSDATITLIGLARDKVDAADDDSAGRPAQPSTIVAGEEGARKAMKKKKKLSSLANDDLKPMQLYYPQASWRLAEIQNEQVGATVFCRRGGDDNEDGKQERAVIVSKVEVMAEKRVPGTSTLLDPFGRFFSSAVPVFDPMRSTYVVRYVADGATERQVAKNVLSVTADTAPLAEGEPRYAIGETVTYAKKMSADASGDGSTEGSDQWLKITEVIRNQLTYNVIFEDGDREPNLTAADVRVRAVATFAVDERVEVNFKNTGRLALAKVVFVSEPNEFGVTLYDVAYELGGEEEEDVDPTRIFKARQPARLKRKAAVYARRRANGAWYAGSVSEVKAALLYRCAYMYSHIDEVTGARIEQGTMVAVLEDDLDSPLKPMRYTDAEGALYRAINLAMFGRVDGESLRQPPRVLTSEQRSELADLCEQHTEEFWNALDPQIFRDIDRSFLHTVRDAQTDKRRRNYIDVSQIVFDAVASVPVDAFDASGLTPLYLACVYADEQIAWHLVEHGADPLMPCIGLKTPSHLIMDSTFSLENGLVASALMKRRDFRPANDGRRKRVRYNFALLNPSFYDLEPNATPNCFTSAEDIADPRRHLGQGISPLRMIVRDGLSDLVDVPVVSKMLDTMWNRFTFRFQLADALSAYATIGLFLLITTRLFGHAHMQVGHLLGEWDWKEWLLVVMMAAIIVIVLLGTRDELYEFRRLGARRYFGNQWNVLEVISYSLLCVTLGLDLGLLLDYLPKHVTRCVEMSADGPSCFSADVLKLKRRVTALSALLVWIRGLKYLTMWKALGTLVRMVEKMMREVVVFAVVFTFFVAAWSNAFTVIMQDAPLPDGAADDPDAPANRFENFGDSLLVCFRLSLGDFEFDDFTYFKEEETVMLALWLSFLFIGAVLMLNLLIAQLSNVYSIITGNVEAEYLLSRAAVIFNTQDQLVTHEPNGSAGRARIENLNVTMVNVTTEESDYNRKENAATRTNDRDTYEESVMAKLSAMELEIYKQTAYIAADSSKAAHRKAAERVAELTGTEVEEHLPRSKSRGAFNAVFGGSQTPRAGTSRGGTPARTRPS
ncbi:hypothetical protein KFE25_012687 [Diacronema lutheri]|uniref:Ion transport domain-containing protein n=1 Tax=Diacronema lutheri TaxID=2081491 RepID=A0A8J5X6F5_DIALT|nr:hypothetical protein KFE25_012687 [Diacronema lutheri]